MKRTTINYRPFCDALRKAGFVKASDSRAGGLRCIEFNRQVGARSVSVQLWGDGRHRVSHMLDGRGSTLPTNFTSVEDMAWAIVNELLREDHRRKL